VNATVQTIARSLRPFARKPGFALSVILTLTLGIGTNIATLTLLYGYLLAPLPYPHAGRLVNIFFTSRKMPGKLHMSYPTYFDLRALAPAIEVAGMSKPKNLDLVSGNRTLHVNGAAVSASLMTTLGVHPLIGRVFASTANRPGAAGEVILSDRLWSLIDAQKPAILGQVIRLNNALYTVIGVMPPNFNFPNPETELWIPKVIEPFDRNPDNLTAFHDQMIARLRPGASLAQLNEQAGAAVAREIAHFPDPSAIPLFKSYGFTAVARPLRHSLVGSLRKNLLLIQLATALVLVLAWVNLSNLFIARALTERGTLLLRRVFGAELRQLFGRLFAGSLMLCLVGAAAGFLFGEGLLKWFLESGLNPSSLAFPAHEWVVSIGIALALAVVSALIFSFSGLYFIKHENLEQVLREGTRTSESLSERRIRAGLVIAQLALACALTGVGLMLARSFLNLSSVNLGFEPTHVLTFEIHLPDRGNAPRPPALAPVLARIHAAISRIPGVTHASLASDIPFDGQEAGDGVFPYPWDHQHQPTEFAVTADAGYFKVFHLPLLAGHNFTPEDATAQQRVAIIDTHAARQLFGTAQAVGREFTFDSPNESNPALKFKVIGIVPATRRVHVGRSSHMGSVYLDRSQVITRSRYWSFAQLSWYVAVRTRLPPASILPELRATLARVAPGTPPYHVRTMTERLSAHLAPRQGLMRIVLLYALSALLIAAVGLYAVQSYGVNQRLSEFGIRAALGADRHQLMVEMLKEMGRLLALGLLLGTLGMVLFGALFAHEFYNVSPLDPLTIIGVCLILSLSVLLAGWAPAWRAGSVPPMRALRGC